MVNAKRAHGSPKPKGANTCQDNPVFQVSSVGYVTVAWMVPVP